MYKLSMAENYWDKERYENSKNSELAVVGYLNEPEFINESYTKWEKSIIIRSTRNRKLKNILDLACGNGRFSIVLAKRAEHLTAVDISSKMLKNCKEKARIFDVNNITFIQSASHKLDTLPNNYDFVCCLGLLEHLPYELQQKTILGINEKLKKNGCLLLEINNSNSFFLKKNIDNEYRKSQQLSNGYYCGLIDKNSILDTLYKMHFQLIKIWINPFFSILRHSVEKKDNDVFKKTVEQAVDLDLSIDYKTEICPNLEQWADQFIFLLKKCK